MTLNPSVFTVKPAFLGCKTSFHLYLKHKTSTTSCSLNTHQVNTAYICETKQQSVFPVFSLQCFTAFFLCLAHYTWLDYFI